MKTGEPLELSCKVQGTPVISITWFKNNSEIASDHRHAMSFDSTIASLDVKECSVEDSGHYVCVASSEAGRDQCSTRVTVKGWCDSLPVLRETSDVWSTLFLHMFPAAEVDGGLMGMGVVDAGGTIQLGCSLQ